MTFVSSGDNLPASVKVGLIHHSIRQCAPHPLQCRNACGFVMTSDLGPVPYHFPIVRLVTPPMFVKSKTWSTLKVRILITQIQRATLVSRGRKIFASVRRVTTCLIEELWRRNKGHPSFVVAVGIGRRPVQNRVSSKLAKHESSAPHHVRCPISRCHRQTVRLIIPVSLLCLIDQTQPMEVFGLRCFAKALSSYSQRPTFFEYHHGEGWLKEALSCDSWPSSRTTTFFQERGYTSGSTYCTSC